MSYEQYRNNFYYRDIIEFLDNKDSYSDEQFVQNAVRIINRHFKLMELPSEFFEGFAKDTSDDLMDKTIKQVLECKDKELFIPIQELLDFSMLLKFGLEIETAGISTGKMKMLFDTKIVDSIMRALEVPDELAEKILNNLDFSQKNENNKWTFSGEGLIVKDGYTQTEVSTPIMTNNLEDLNQIKAICLLFKAIGAKTPVEELGLHINIGVDFLECNENALLNILNLWGECEELFFMISNQKNEETRNFAELTAMPVKENIQSFIKKISESDGSLSIKTDEEMEYFLFYIQTQNRMDKFFDSIKDMYNIDEKDLKIIHDKNAPFEVKFDIFKKYMKLFKESETYDDVRFTSINFNHMKWNAKEPGRVEIRLFNSSLDPEIIFQNLLLVAKVFEVSLYNAKDPNYKKEEFERLKLHNVTEEVKLQNLLDLLFDNPKEKEIFRERWESVRGLKVYKKYETGNPTYIREEKNRELYY